MEKKKKMMILKKVILGKMVTVSLGGTTTQSGKYSARCQFGNNKHFYIDTYTTKGASSVYKEVNMK